MSELVLRTVFMPHGMGNLGSVLLGLTPFPLDLVDQLNPADPLESSSQFREVDFEALLM